MPLDAIDGRRRGWEQKGGIVHMEKPLVPGLTFRGGTPGRGATAMQVQATIRIFSGNRLCLSMKVAPNM